MAKNNESFGLAAEVAIAKTFGVPINQHYAMRAEKSIVAHLLKNDAILQIFETENIPLPYEHIAEDQNPVDFILSDNSTLSVKTNQNKLGKVAPQKIGQPTSETYFSYLERYFEDFKLADYLRQHNLSNSYEDRSIAFKQLSMTHTDKLLDMYWCNLFDCDYYLHFYNLATLSNPLKNYVLLKKEVPPVWDRDKITFTQSLNSWNESNTLKYDGVSIGEFQVHKHRNCFKFRFNVDNIIDLISSGYM